MRNSARNKVLVKAPPKTRARKPVNLSASAALVDEARALGLNLSRVFEEALDARLRQSRVQRWQQENREAIEHYNAHIREHGVWSKSVRRF